MPDTADVVRPQTKPRTAILLFGLLREFEVAAPSFMLHVADPLDADIFYAGPAESDRPLVSHKGTADRFGGMKVNPKQFIDKMLPVDPEAVQRVYGARLKAVHYHRENVSRFSTEAAEHVAPRDWLFKLNPARMFSMFYNIQAVVKLFMEYEKNSGVTYDQVILTRPDLAFYRPLNFKLRQNELHTPQGEGFDAYGHKHTGSAPVIYYRNVERGWYVPAGRHIQFNDQLFLMKRANLHLFDGIHAALCEYMLLRVPASPETVFYLHLVVRGGLHNVLHPEWLYEIRRAGMPVIENVVDTNEIMFVDRNHPVALQLRRRRPLASMLRDAKHIYRKVSQRIRR